MINRKDTPFLIDLPKEWTEKVTDLLHESYMHQVDTLSVKFEVYGQLYKGELLVIASLLDAKDDSLAPTSYFVSMDLEDGQDHTKLLDSIVDSIGAFFDNYFSIPDWSDYTNNWQEEEFKGMKLFVKTSRENVKLTLQADALLNQ